MTTRDLVILLALGMLAVISLVLTWPEYNQPLLRITLFVSWGSLLGILALNGVNAGTVGDWFPEEWQNELAKAIVVGAFVLGIFYLAATS